MSRTCSMSERKYLHLTFPEMDERLHCQEVMDTLSRYEYLVVCTRDKSVTRFDMKPWLVNQVVVPILKGVRSEESPLSLLQGFPWILAYITQRSLPETLRVETEMPLL